jgi:hypothetical protein
MSKRVTFLAMLAAVSAACENAIAGTTNAPLTFYLVSKQRIEGGQLFNRFPVPEPGYIASKPNLIVEHIKDVSSLPESSRAGWAEDRNEGTRRKATIITVERFFFTLHDEDAARLRRLAETAGRQSQLVLVLFGDKAIELLRTEDIPAKTQFEVTGNWGRAGVKEIADALKDLVR